jgi:hypothetical protein
MNAVFNKNVYCLAACMQACKICVPHTHALEKNSQPPIPEEEVVVVEQEEFQCVRDTSVKLGRRPSLSKNLS